MKIRAMCACLLFACGIPALAVAIVPSPQVVYTVNLDQTKNGNDVTDVILVEQYGPDSYRFSREGSMTPGGQTVFATTYIGQFAAAIVGLDGPAPSFGPTPSVVTDADKWHMIFAMNTASANAAAGQVISTLYPPAHENPTIGAIIAWYEHDDPDGLTALQTFFGTDAHSALFSVPGPFTIVEFSPATQIGSGSGTVTPEPATVALTGIAALAICAVKRRLAA